ncbi:MAG TPA: alanine racemase, partial [Puia sp.]|nr:alanine racemase [Puia sp.]
QSNKVKYITPFVHLIHGVDSAKLLKEIGRQAGKNRRTIDVLLQVHIAREETKFGFDADELGEVMEMARMGGGEGLRVRGLMGMASFVADTQPERVREEFRVLKGLFDKYFPADRSSGVGRDGQKDDPYLLSMGMSGDYKIALEEGSNMVRIGSLLFGARG